ncbi:MAG TPA: DUF1232 domain-containing protein [Aeromonadales bacterium]|nr:DUF1232 domain-containing protein [Aeromonadales bacterium]
MSNIDFYQQLRDKFSAWSQTDEGKNYQFARYLLAAPDLFHLMCKLTLDKRVSVKHKAMLGGAVAYFISPIDLIPEAIVGPLGYVDDIGMAAYVLKTIINENPEPVIEHWAGDGDVLELVQKILDAADKMLGSGLWKKVKKYL